MRRVELFSIDQQRHDEAWLNDTTPLPAVPMTKPCTAFTEQVCREIARYAAFFDDIPSAIRVNPCTVLELPRDRWEVFPFFYEGRIIGIAVVADQAVPIGEIVCEGNDNTLTALETL